MTRNYFASTDETETYYFEEPTATDRKGVFVTIKTHLSWGERKRLDSAAVTSMSTEQRQAMANGQEVDGADQEEAARTMTYGLNLFVPNFLKLACYIVDWNLPDRNGRPMRLPRNLDEKARLMERLDATVGDEIAAWIDEFVEKQQKALTEAKERDGSALNGVVSEAQTARLVDGRVVPVDDEGNPTRLPAGASPYGG